MFKSRLFQYSLVFFICVNIFLYLFIFFFHGSIKFNAYNYIYSSHHFIDDNRLGGGNFTLVNGLGVWDAQWYIRIAEAGYPPLVLFDQYDDPHYMGGLSYAFFPLFPILVNLFYRLTGDIEIAGFIFANFFLLVNFFSLYYVTAKLYSEKIAAGTVLLLFFFPFSIFYRSYFSEDIFLFLIIWFTYFLIQKKWFLATLAVGLLSITRPNGIVLLALLFFNFLSVVVKKEIGIPKALVYLALSIVPFFAWLWFCYMQTGNSLYWYEVQAVWFKSSTIYYPLIHNFAMFLTFWHLPFHTYHASKVDMFFLVVNSILLVLSRKFLKPQLWWFSLTIVLVPLFIKDTMSFSRYQIVSFPLFIYLAAQLDTINYRLLLGVFTVLLFLVSLYFVNWYWIG